MDKTYTAYLGALGEAGPDGFGASQSDTRPIHISDNDGAIVYSKRSGDTAKAADSHIKVAGYSRTGEWRDGVAPVTPRKLNGIRNAVPTLIGVGLVISLFVSCQAILTPSDEPDEVGPVDARVMCEEFVSERLNSPSSGKYSNQTETGSGASWTARGSVDADNSFGAAIRGSYTCELTYDPSDESWTSRTVIDR